jgi:hypothetical protein
VQEPASVHASEENQNAHVRSAADKKDILNDKGKVDPARKVKGKWYIETSKYLVEPNPCPGQVS